MSIGGSAEPAGRRRRRVSPPFDTPRIKSGATQGEGNCPGETRNARLIPSRIPQPRPPRMSRLAGMRASGPRARDAKGSGWRAGRRDGEDPHLILIGHPCLRGSTSRSSGKRHRHSMALSTVRRSVGGIDGCPDRRVRRNAHEPAPARYVRCALRSSPALAVRQPGRALPGTTGAGRAMIRRQAADRAVAIRRDRAGAEPRTLRLRPRASGPAGRGRAGPGGA